MKAKRTKHTYENNTKHKTLTIKLENGLDNPAMMTHHIAKDLVEV